MRTSFIFALALLCTILIVACGTGPQPAQPKILECSIDDTLVFVAQNVTAWEVTGATLVATNQDNTRLARQMLPNETCVDRTP